MNSNKLKKRLRDFSVKLFTSKWKTKRDRDTMTEKGFRAPFI